MTDAKAFRNHSAADGGQVGATARVDDMGVVALATEEPTGGEFALAGSGMRLEELVVGFGNGVGGGGDEGVSFRFQRAFQHHGKD